MKRSAAGFAVLLFAVAAPGLAVAQNAPSLRLFSDTGFAGDSRRIDRGVENLDRLQFNDAARSLIAEGRWEVCLDARYAGACRIVQGQVSDMGDWAGSVSSVRYLGPGDWGSGAGSGSVASGPAGSSQVAGTTGGQGSTGPVYRVDYRPEMIGRVYDTDFGPMTLDRYDSQGAAGRYGAGADAGTFEGLVRPADHGVDGYDTVEGYWYQSTSAQRCSRARNGTYYWGRMQLNFPIETNDFIGFYGHCDGTPLDRWNGNYIHRDRVIAAAVDAQVQAGGGAVTAGQTVGARPGASGGVDSQGRPLPGVVDRAADVATDEVERQVHDRIREGIGRIF